MNTQGPILKIEHILGVSVKSQIDFTLEDFSNEKGEIKTQEYCQKIANESFESFKEKYQDFYKGARDTTICYLHTRITEAIDMNEELKVDIQNCCIRTKAMPITREIINQENISKYLKKPTYEILGEDLLKRDEINHTIPLIVASPIDTEKNFYMQTQYENIFKTMQEIKPAHTDFDNKKESLNTLINALRWIIEREQQKFIEYAKSIQQEKEKQHTQKPKSKFCRR